MSDALALVQAFLAVVFLAHGLLFLFPPAAVREIEKQSPFPAALMRPIYAAEVLAAFGLTLPGWTGLLPWLTPLAAAGLVPIMVGAVAYHLSRREVPPAVFTAVLLALAALVACARLVVTPV